MTDFNQQNSDQGSSAARIYKYALHRPNDEGLAQSEPMQPQAHALSVGIQDGQMVVWARIDGDLSQYPSDERHFIVLNTGQEVAAHRLDGARFIGTVTSDMGIVWHVWEDDQLA